LLRAFLTTAVFRATTSELTATVGPGCIVTLGAAVHADSEEPAQPSGTVRFYADGQRTGKTLRVAAGTAPQLAVSFSPGRHTISVKYSGNKYYNLSASTAAPITCR
jgi:hypothetical protein